MHETLDQHNDHIKQRKRKENILAILCALAISLPLYMLFSSDLEWLTADIAGGGIEYNEYSDVVLTIKDANRLDLVFGKTMNNLKSLSILVLFDPENVRLTVDDIVSAHTHVYSDAWQGQWSIILSFDEEEIFDVGDSIVEIAAPWIVQHLVVWDTIATFTDGGTERLSVQLPK